MPIVEDFLDHSTPTLQEAILAAVESAANAGQRLQLAHLLRALLALPEVVRRVPQNLGSTALGGLEEQIRTFSLEGSNLSSPGFDLANLISRAIDAAEGHGAGSITPLTLLTVCLSAGALTDSASIESQQRMASAGLTLESLAAAMPSADFTFRPLGFGTDLTAMARAGVWPICPLIGLERELRRLVQTLAAGGDSVVVVGEPGVGKSALLYGLAFHIARGTRPLIPPDLDKSVVVAVTPINLLSGTGARGELESRIEKMLTFFRKNRAVVPFFDEIHTLLDTTDSTARAVATALKPPMASGEFRCIGATTDKEYARFIAGDDAINSRFTKLLIQEPDAATATKIVAGTIPNLLSPVAKKFGVSVGEDAASSAVSLTARYLRNDRLPRKAIRLLKATINEKVYALQTSAVSQAAVSAADVIATLSDVSGIPAEVLGRDDLAGLRKRLERRVRGQPDAISSVTQWLSIQTRGWLDSRRPRGRFLFVGPPGVGKTELANALAEEVIRDRGSVVVKNMAEFKGDGARTRFMGSDPGYVGFGQTATIYSQVMMRPYSVVVLDEFEKASPELANPLLSVFDGYAEDSQGRWVDFSQCIFVLTSNALTMDGPGTEDAMRANLLAAGGIWQAPLVDRIDRIAHFAPLTRETRKQILADQIARRRSAASSPLPQRLNTNEAMQEILDAAEGGQSSARGVERSLARWLIKETVNS